MHLAHPTAQARDATARIGPPDPRFVHPVRPDPTDRRDRIYAPPLRPLAPTLSPPDALVERLAERRPFFPRDQRTTPTCAAQALAALVDLQTLMRGDAPARALRPSSAEMLHAIARAVRGGPGDGGLTLRQVVKAFYHYGVCADDAWPFEEGREGSRLPALTPERARDARRNCLGAYLRLAPRLDHYHAALNEVGVVLASAVIHDGWVELEDAPCGRGRMIGRAETSLKVPDAFGHGFLVVGYTPDGFLVLNSWGPGWGGWEGAGGLALWPYRDWAEQVGDAYVLRVGVPAPSAFDFVVGQWGTVAVGPPEPVGSAPASRVVGHHLLIEDGAFRDEGPYATDRGTLGETLRLLAARGREGRCRGVHLTLHGALLDEKEAVAAAVAEKDALKAAGLYPLSVIWCAELAAELRGAVERAVRRAERRRGGPGEAADRLAGEMLRGVGRALWREIERSAEAAAGPGGAFAQAMEDLWEGSDLPVHLVALGEGALLLAAWLRRCAPSPGLRSVDLVAPPMPSAEVRRAFEPLAAAMPPLPCGTRGPVRLHVPSEALRPRLRFAGHGGPQALLMARGPIGPADPGGGRLDLRALDLPGTEPVDQRELVHGAATARALRALLPDAPRHGPDRRRGR